MKTLILLLALAATALADNVTVTNPSNQPVPVRLIGTVVTMAQLPTNHSVGQTATITNGPLGLAWGAVVTSADVPATAKYLLWWNGTAWTVIGK